MFMKISALSALGFLTLSSMLAAEGGNKPGPGAERWPDKLKEGDDAPDFTLKSPDGKTSFTLSALKDKKPVVLIFGSFT